MPSRGAPWSVGPVAIASVALLSSGFDDRL